MSENRKRNPEAIKEQTFQRLYSIEGFQKREEGEDGQEVYRFKLSSDKPIEVYPGELEILSHEREAVDLEFLNSGTAPLLWMHDRRDYRGVIDKAEVEGGFVFVECRFGTRDNAQELKADVDAGIIKNVSIGFRILAWELTESREDGPDVYTITKWKALEGSFVTIPADESVGMGRSESFRSLLSEDDNNEETPEPAEPPRRHQNIRTMPEQNDPAPVIDLEKERGDAASEGAAAERKRQTGIREIASKTKIPGVDLNELAERACAEDVTVEAFREQVLDTIQRNAPKLNQIDIGATPKERKRYSIQKVMEGIRSGNVAKHAPYEYEISEELKERMGKGGDTIAIPHDVVLRGWIPKDSRALSVMAHNYGVSERDLSAITLNGAGQNNTASNIVETELLDEMFIYSLREESSLLDAGVIMIPGLVGNVEIPVELLNPDFYWVGEDEEPTQGTYTLGKVGLNFRTLAAQIPFTRQAEKQTTPGLENLLTRSLRIGSSLGLASAFYNGTGSNGQPTGIMNTAGVGSVDTNGATTRDVLIDLEIALGTANAQGEAFTAMNTALAGAFAKTKVDAGSGQFVGRYRRGARRLLETEIGDVSIDNLVPADHIVHGIPSTLVAGMWGTMELGIDTATKAATGGKVIRVFLDADCVVPQPATWVVGEDVA